jgi:hypothetical protein
LLKENAELKSKCWELQEQGVKDKEKIKNLIIRINEVKNGRSDAKSRPPSVAKLPTYHNGTVSSHSLLPKKLETPYKSISIAQCDNQECL